jgi:hypothetical protein
LGRRREDERIRRRKMKLRTLDEYPTSETKKQNLSVVERCLSEIEAVRRKNREWYKTHRVIRCAGCGGMIDILTKEQMLRMMGKMGNIYKNRYCQKCIEEGVPEIYGW